MYSFPTSKGFVTSELKIQNNTVIEQSNFIHPKYLFLKCSYTNDQWTDFKDLGNYFTNFAILENTDQNACNFVLQYAFDDNNVQNTTYIHDDYLIFSTRRGAMDRYIAFKFDIPDNTPIEIQVRDAFNVPIIEISNTATQYSPVNAIYYFRFNSPIPALVSKEMILYYKQFITNGND